MEIFNHVIKTLDIELNSNLERTVQISGINSMMQLLWMNDTSLGMLEYKKSDTLVPIRNYYIASMRLFIKYCKYRTWASDPITDYLTLTKEHLDEFNLMAHVTVTATILGSST